MHVGRTTVRSVAWSEWRFVTGRPFRAIPLDSVPFRCPKTPKPTRISAPVRSDPLVSAIFRSEARDDPKHDLPTPEQKVSGSNPPGRTKSLGNSGGS